MRSGTDPNIVQGKLNGRGRHPRVAARQQTQAPQAASEKEIKVSLNNVIQDIQLSPQISMVTNVPACTVSLAHQAVTQKKTSTSPSLDSRSFSADLRPFDSLSYLIKDVYRSRSSPSFLDVWEDLPGNLAQLLHKNLHFHTRTPPTVSVHHGNAMETQQKGANSHTGLSTPERHVSEFEISTGGRRENSREKHPNRF